MNQKSVERVKSDNLEKHYAILYLLLKLHFSPISDNIQNNWFYGLLNRVLCIVKPLKSLWIIWLNLVDNVVPKYFFPVYFPAYFSICCQSHKMLNIYLNCITYEKQKIRIIPWTQKFNFQFYRSLCKYCFGKGCIFFYRDQLFNTL